MNDDSLIALYDRLKRGGPQGKMGGLGFRGTGGGPKVIIKR